MHISTVNHRVGVPKMFDKAVICKDIADLVFVQRVMRHHEISTDRFAPCDFASAIGGKTVELDLLVCADLTQSCNLLQDLQVKALARPCLRCSHTIHAAVDNQHRFNVFVLPATQSASYF